MKLKYYLRGIGIGVILTALIMGFALGGRKTTISDAEVIERAKALGMVQGGVLSDYSGEGDSIEDTSNTSSADQASAQTSIAQREETTTESSSEVTLSGSQVQEVAAADPKEDSAKAEKDSTKVEKDGADVKVDATDVAKTDNAPKEEAKAVAEADNAPKDKAEDSGKAKESESKNDDSVAEAAKNVAAQTSAQDPAFSNEAKTVTIPGGKSSDQVAQILYNEGIIDNPTSFNKYLIERGVDRVIRSGTKDFPADATYEQVASIITR